MNAMPNLETIAAGALLLAALAATADAQEAGSPMKAAAVDAEAILRPPAADYRTAWAHLGTFSVLTGKPADDGKQMHVVYTERKNIEAYLKNGRFPDGAVIVKDVFASRTEALTTGAASFAGRLSGRFVMVKDAAGRLGSGPRFGDGWGWAFFEGDEKVKTVTTAYKTDCLTCHEPARNQDLLFLQGYPVLKK